jgi:hypothetical protein
MKHLHKQCQNINQVNKYLESVALSDFALDPEFTGEFDHDGWVDGKEQNGVSINVTKSFEVFVVKYTEKDLAELEKEL